MRHIQLLLSIYLIIKCPVISIIPAMIVIHQSTHMMKNIIRTIIHMLPMAVIGMHLLMIMRIQAVIYIIMQKVQEEIITGSIVIAKGKYIWTIEEDFTLFIKSISESSDKLLSGIDNRRKGSISDTRRAVIKAQLAYLLAQQYIDATYTLNELITPVKQNNAQIFYIDSMLEIQANAPFLRAGMTLYPQSLKNHRLYLKTKSGNAAGYISFRDDRLYYIIIPLLEQKRAQVKVQIATRQDKNNTRHNVKYKNLDFWIKISDNNSGTFPESINMQIEEILTKYSKM